ncbi:MAG: hypothetical protein ACFB3T_13395 [Geminicoccaceae bacterium]
MSKNHSSETESASSNTDAKCAKGDNAQDPVKLYISKATSPSVLSLLFKQDRLIVISLSTITIIILIAAMYPIASKADHYENFLKLCFLSIIIIFFMILFVIRAGKNSAPIEVELESRAKAASSVNGFWWQTVRSQSHSGLTFIYINLSHIPGRHSILGISFDNRGQTDSRFFSRVVAISAEDPIELYFVYRGATYRDLPDGARIVTGIGRMRFDRFGNDKRASEAESEFTDGDPREFTFGKTMLSEMVRFDEDEESRMLTDPKCIRKLATEAYKKFHEQNFI